MAIDLSKYLGGTTGTWNYGGLTLPDYGFTETRAPVTSPTFSNRAVSQYYSAQSQPAVVSPLPDTGPWSTQTNPNVGTPSSQPSSGGGGWSRLQQLSQTSRNPSEETEYQNMLKALQQGQGISDEQINAMYNPLVDVLNQQRAGYESQYPLYQKQVEEQTAAGLQDVANQQAESQANLTKQGTNVTSTEQNALQQARQLYNELAQRYGAMFGSRTSAGPFAMEILGREAQKQFGGIGQTATAGREAVKEESNKLGRWVDTQKNEWGRKKTEALNNLQISFQNALQSINAQRGQLESDKAQRRYQALVDARSQVAQIQAADVAFSRQLALFQAQNTPASYQTPDVTSAQVAQLASPWNATSANMGTPASVQNAYAYAPTGANYRLVYDPSTGKMKQVAN